MRSTLTGPVSTYLAHVRHELRDLPPSELEDVLDDVADHLTEVAAELDGSRPGAAAGADAGAAVDTGGLEGRLGTPRQYADELRSAAGYPPRSPEPGAAGGSGALRWAIIAATVGPFFVVLGIFGADRKSALAVLFGLGVIGAAGRFGVRALHGRDPRIVLDTPRGAGVAGTLRGILDQLPPALRRDLRTIGQPVWWVARGLVAGGGFIAAFSTGPVAVVAALAGAVASVWIGRRTQEDRRWLWYVVPLNVVAAVAVPAWLVASLTGHGPDPFVHNRYAIPEYARPSGLSFNGDEIVNLYPFDEQGRPVKVRLYDPTGRPVSVPYQGCAPVDAGGETTNLFPVRWVVSDPDGSADPQECTDTDQPRFVPPPGLATATRPTPGTSTSQPTPSVTGSLPTPGASVSQPSPAPRTPGATLTPGPTR